MKLLNYVLLQLFINLSMSKSHSLNSRIQQFRFTKILKRKVLLSNELKKSLFIAFSEAKTKRVYVNIDLLLYGLINNPSSLAARLVSLTFSQFQNNSSLNSRVLSKRIYGINNQKFIENNKSNSFSLEMQKENQTTPWITIEAKEMLKNCTLTLLKSKKKINILTTKHVLFELLNKESIRTFLRQLTD